MVLENLAPKHVWRIFEDVFTKTPRESKHEEKIHHALIDWLKEQQQTTDQKFEILSDAVGNILVKVPPTPGMEHHPSILLQGHMDMVCETDLPNGFDFDSNSIPVKVESNNEWVTADHTTLGADNGIGLALALGILVDDSVKHGPLEILATVDEETGLTGAFQLDIDKLNIESKLLINIDSESIGNITIGSAGGGDTVYEKKFQRDTAVNPSSLNFWSLTINGLAGGHSGGEIHLPKANAIKLITRILAAANLKIPLYLHSWKGGSKHNAIPRSSTVVFAIRKTDQEKFTSIFQSQEQEIHDYYQDFEPNMQILLESTNVHSIFTNSDTENFVRLMHQIPHGVIRFSPQVEGLVETSNNLAIVKTTEESVKIHNSSRSNLDTELNDFRRKLWELGQIMNWKTTQPPSYPGWSPNPKSTFLHYVKDQYQEALDQKIEVEAIHAGLECGVIGAKIPGIQMLSIGPDIHNPHTPEERVRIESVQIFYQLLKKILENIAHYH